MRMGGIRERPMARQHSDVYHGVQEGHEERGRASEEDRVACRRQAWQMCKKELGVSVGTMERGAGRK